MRTCAAHYDLAYIDFNVDAAVAEKARPIIQKTPLVNLFHTLIQPTMKLIILLFYIHYGDYRLWAFTKRTGYVTMKEFNYIQN
jgi:hypothetical protein